MTQEVHVGTRIDLAQHPVEVERLGVELEVEPLGEHHLEDVAGENVFAGRLDGRAVDVLPHRRHDLGDLLVARRGFDQRFVDGPRPVGRELVEAGQGVVVGRVDRRRVGVVGDQGVGDQHDPLLPVVVDGQLADHRDDGVGIAEIVVGNVGQVLDLADDVVAQVADQAAVQRRQSGDLGRPIVVEQTLQRDEYALVSGYVDAEVALDAQRAVLRHECPVRAPADERPATPAVAALHRLEQESIPVAHHAGEGRHRRGEIGEQLTPHRHDPMVGRETPELVELGEDGHRLRRTRASRRR